MIRLPEYGPQLRSQGYQTIDDVFQISIEDLEDVGIYKLGHQKRFLLAVKKIKSLKSGRINRPPSMNVGMTGGGHYAPGLNMRKSSFDSPQKTALRPTMPSPPGLPPQQSATLYQPEVIQIVKPNQKPPISGHLSPHKSMSHDNYQQDFYQPHKSYSLYTSSPQKSPNVLPSIPEPMKPFNHLSSPGKSTFASISSTYRNPVISEHLPLRSFDDSQLSMNKTINSFSSMTNVASGGTLPRPKGLVKPLPVAKIPATLRDNSSFKSFEDNELNGQLEPKLALADLKAEVGNPVKTKKEQIYRTR